MLSLNDSRSNSLTNLNQNGQLNQNQPPKVKRRAPKPPQKPVERPKSMPIPKQRLTEDSRIGNSPVLNHKKRQVRNRQSEKRCGFCQIYILMIFLRHQQGLQHPSLESTKKLMLKTKMIGFLQILYPLHHLKTFLHL